MRFKHFIFSINLFPFCSFTWTNIIIVRRNKGTNILLIIITRAVCRPYNLNFNNLQEKSLFYFNPYSVCNKIIHQIQSKISNDTFCHNNGIDGFYQDNVPMVTSQLLKDQIIVHKNNLIIFTATEYSYICIDIFIKYICIYVCVLKNYIQRYT